MLKKLILASAIMAGTVGIANAAAPYVGAGLGISVNTAEATDSHPTLNARGVPVNVLAGYGGLIDQSIYLAGELNATIATGNISDDGLRSTYSYGASIIPGMMLSEHTLAFARAGVVKTHFDTVDSNQTGGLVGLGLQTSVTQNVDVRGEYDYTAYRHFNENGSSVDPVSDAFNLSLVYKFE